MRGWKESVLSSYVFLAPYQAVYIMHLEQYTDFIFLFFPFIQLWCT